MDDQPHKQLASLLSPFGSDPAVGLPAMPRQVMRSPMPAFPLGFAYPWDLILDALRACSPGTKIIASHEQSSFRSSASGVTVDHLESAAEGG